jgi:hypothetical protein
MTINAKAALNGDRNELLKLARSIQPAKAPLAKGSPLGSQFFDSEPSGMRPLDLATLLNSMAGEDFNQHVEWVEAMAAAGYAGIALNRPSKTADVTRIGAGPGWTAPKPTIASGTKAAGLEAALRKNRVANGTTATTANADTGILTALLKEIVKSLIGVDPDSLDSGTVKTRFTAALKKAGSQVQAQVKTITDELEEAKLKAAFTSTGGKWVRDGSHLRLSV